jgi:hypothetical protein
MGSDSMDCKEFLKPTKAKLLLAALLYLLFIPFINQYTEYVCPPGRSDCPQSIDKHVSVIEALLLTGTVAQSYMWHFLIVGIPISYLAACILAYAYAKLARKSGKKSKNRK